MAKYDPQIIEKFADELYTQAASVIARLAILGCVIGLIAGGAFGAAMAKQMTGTLVVIGGITGAWGGWQMGRERAFQLRLKAQRALCQLQIEKNTRPEVGTAPPLVAH